MTVEVPRRGFLKAAVGGAGVAAAAGRTAAQNGPDFGGWFDDVPNYDGVVDRTGQDEVTVTVGAEPNDNFSFEPAAVRVDPGATVVWEWSGNGGGHNVVHDGGEFESGDPVAEAGTTFEYTFDSAGIFKYFCEPHRSLGMKGAVVVGSAGSEDGGGGGPPDFGDWFSDVPYFEGVTDATGQSEATVTVGGEPNSSLSFVPAAIHVDNGATVVWEWTGEGGAHNVIHEGEAFDSGQPVAEAGTTFEHTFESDGIYNYFCEPHRSAGMKGSVVVGTDYPTTGDGGDGDGEGGRRNIPDSAMTLGVATGAVMTVTLGLAYVFLKYGGSGGGE